MATDLHSSGHKGYQTAFVWSPGVGGRGFSPTHLSSSVQKYRHLTQISSVLNWTNECHIHETAPYSFWRLFTAPAGFFSVVLCRLFVLRRITDSNDEDPLSQEVSCGHEVHGVLCEASLPCSGRVMQTTISEGEIAPDKLITSLLQNEQPGPSVVPPTAGPHKRPSCQCPGAIRKLFESPGWKGSIFHIDKEPNDIIYSRFGVLSGLLLCSAGGDSNTVNPSSVCPKK